MKRRKSSMMIVLSWTLVAALFSCCCDRVRSLDPGQGNRVDAANHIVFRAKETDVEGDTEQQHQRYDPFLEAIRQQQVETSNDQGLDKIKINTEKQWSEANIDELRSPEVISMQLPSRSQQTQHQAQQQRSNRQQQQQVQAATTQAPVQHSRVASNQVVYNQIPTDDRTNPYPSQPYVVYMPAPGPSSAAASQNPQLVGSERTMEQFLDRLLHESIYDRRIRPFYTDSKNSKPVDVNMNMHINTISGISEVNMEFIVDCYFRQEWHDPRLMYSNSSWRHVEDITLHYDLVNKVWTPDAFFRNSKDAKGHSITVPNKLIRIFPEGRVLFSQRLTLRLECPMKLQKFPLDNQTCTINIGSYGYTLKDIRFDWYPSSANSDPVTISNKLEMPDFILTTHNATVCQRKTSTGEYACLEVRIELQRDLSSYITDIYIPSSFVVSLSFISFFIDHRSAAARAPLGATSVLTITTMFGGSYACLEVHFYLKRSFGYYLVQVYIPSVLTCFIAFVSFWIDHKAVPARISVGLLTVLTVTTQSSGIRSQLPKVSYIKAIDVWMSACLVFVFAALLEYAVVNVIARKQELKKLVRLSERHKQERKMRKYKSQQQKLETAAAAAAAASAMPNSAEKVLVIGNRLANMNYKKEQDLLHQSLEALDTLLPAGSSGGGNHIHQHPHHAHIKTPHSAHSLHVDSAVSISGASHQSTPPPVTVVAVPPAPPPVATPVAAAAPQPPRDDAQMVDFASSFLFPISFIIFNIIYWMVYLNMQVESGY